MRVLMLGWEFSPAISGGIGTACFGLTRALVREGAQVTFVLPRDPDLEPTRDFELVDLDMPRAAAPSGPPAGLSPPEPPDDPRPDDDLPYSADGPNGSAPHATVEPTLEAEGRADDSFSDEAVRPEFVPGEIARVQQQAPAQFHDKPTPDPGRPPHQGWITRTEAHKSYVPAGSGLPGVEFIALDSFLMPYGRPDAPWRPPPTQERKTYFEQVIELREIGRQYPVPPAPRVEPPALPSTAEPSTWLGIYRAQVAAHSTDGGDGHARPAPRRGGPPPPARAGHALFTEVERFAHLAADAAAQHAFDVVHAHDWMTFPAAQAIAEIAGCPLILHVHSTEFDRSAFQIDQRIYDIERRGLERADRIIAVSHLTQGILTHRYGIPAEKIHVVYNAVDCGAPSGNGHTLHDIERDEKIVLFLGRVTVQKGPEYFLAAARKVLQVYRNVRFVIAGAGDAVQATMALADDMGLGDRIIFTGFLNGGDVERMFRAADLYIMPSVSDPFGIAALEALSYDVPVLISKQSGAAEVLRHVLKVDFWDIDEMANKIVAVLRHPPLHTMLKRHGSYEVRRLTWADAARRCTEIYALARGEPVVS